MSRIFNFTPNKETLSVTIERSFDAPLETVWSAWTEAEFLDQWWGPKPFHVETKSRSFSEGGVWLYAMVGPDGQRHWASQKYSKIEPRKRFSFRSLFCDENGTVAPGTTGSDWLNSFAQKDGFTLVTNEIKVDSLAHLEAQMKMGFKEGYSAGLDQLEELLARLVRKGK